MATPQFERIPIYNRVHQSHGATTSTSEETWEGRRFTPLPLNELVRTDSGECVIANGHPMSPLSSVDSDRDLPDTPGIYRTQSFDVTVFDIRKVPPEQLAAQITLIDLEIFKAIRMEEFSNCNWTKKEKQRLAPNIVAFTRRFNHMSFLVVREILNEEHEKARAEVISHFIKIAKKLFELNNLHSLKAVVSALQSAPIFRLHQTWKHVHKKDKASFEKLEDFMSDNENRKVLREHMDEAKLPCIPHLGLYLTDLCYLFDIPNREHQVESTLNMIAYCQNSTYDSLFVEPHVQKYLTHVRYIDELQKFFEDDNYKLSLKYEPSLTPELLRKRHTENNISSLPPANSMLRSSKSHEDLMSQLAAEGVEPESPFSSEQRQSYMRRSLNTKSVTQHSSPVTSSSTKLARHKFSVPTLSEQRAERFSSSSVEVVRKTVTLPNSLKETQLLSPFSEDEWAQQKPRSASDWTASGRHKAQASTSFSSLGTSGSGRHPSPSVANRKAFPPPSPLSQSKSKVKGHKKSNSLGTNVLVNMFGRPAPLDIRSDVSPEPPPPTALSLLDDSLLDDTFNFTPTGSIGNVSTSGGSSHASLEEFSMGDQLFRHFPEDSEEEEADKCLSWDTIKEGSLKRKSLKHNGVAVSQLRGRSKCWVQLTSSSIIFMEAKPKRGKKQSKPIKATCVKLKACRLKHRDPSEKLTDEQFIINDDNGNSTKFTAKSVAAAMEWVVAIKEAIRVEEEREREEAERSLIKL